MALCNQWGTNALAVIRLGDFDGSVEGHPWLAGELHLISFITLHLASEAISFGPAFTNVFASLGRKTATQDRKRHAHEGRIRRRAVASAFDFEGKSFSADPPGFSGYS
jgi:polygalacturonase